MQKTVSGSRSEVTGAARGGRSRSAENPSGMPDHSSRTGQSIGIYSLPDRIERMQQWHKKRGELDIKNGTKLRYGVRRTSALAKRRGANGSFVTTSESSNGYGHHEEDRDTDSSPRASEDMSSGGRRLSMVESEHSSGAVACAGGAGGEAWAMEGHDSAGMSAPSSNIKRRGRPPLYTKTGAAQYLAGTTSMNPSSRRTEHDAEGDDQDDSVEEEESQAEEGDIDNDELDTEQQTLLSSLLSPNTAEAVAAALAYKTGLKKRRRRGALKKRLSPMPKRRRRTLGAASLTSPGSDGAEAFVSRARKPVGAAAAVPGSGPRVKTADRRPQPDQDEEEDDTDEEVVRPAWVTRAGRSVVAKVLSPASHSQHTPTGPTSGRGSVSTAPSGSSGRGSVPGRVSAHDSSAAPKYWRAAGVASQDIKEAQTQEGKAEEVQLDTSNKRRKAYTPRSTVSKIQASEPVQPIEPAKLNPLTPAPMAAATAQRSVRAESQSAGTADVKSVPSEPEDKGTDDTLPVKGRLSSGTPSSGTNSRVSSYVGSVSDPDYSVRGEGAVGAGAMPLPVEHAAPAAAVWAQTATSITGSFPAPPRAFPPLPTPTPLMHHKQPASQQQYHPPMTSPASAAGPRRAPPKGATIWTRGGDSVRVEPYQPASSAPGAGTGSGTGRAHASVRSPSGMSSGQHPWTSAYQPAAVHPYAHTWLMPQAQSGEEMDTASYADSTVQHSPTAAGIDEASVLMQMMVGAVRSAAQEATRQALASVHVHAHGQHPSAVTYTYGHHVHPHPGQSLPSMGQMHMNMFSPGGTYVSYMGTPPINM